MKMMHQNVRLTLQELDLVYSEVERRKKSLVVAYLFWLFFGLLGAHRYYFNRFKSAIVMTVLIFVLGGAAIGILVSLIWTLIDGLLMLKWLARDREQLETDAIQNVLAKRRWCQSKH